MATKTVAEPNTASGQNSSTHSKAHSEAAKAFNATEIKNIEHWTGLAATENSWFSYSGITYAPFVAIHASGLRLRAAGGYGQYYYDSTLSFAGENIALRFMGETVSIEAMLGYQLQMGQWITKLFIGVEFQEHLITPTDPRNAISGSETGLKIASENWWNIGNRSWASLDGNYSTSFNSYAVELKAGYNITGPLHIGGLVGGFGNDTLNAARGGLLLRYKDQLREITLTGGYSGDYDDPSNPFGSLTYLTAF